MLYAVFGDPIAHSLSPAMMKAAFAACGIDAIYLAFRIDAADLGAAVASIRALGLGGVNVTLPHKRAVVPFLDGTAGEAAESGSVNTIVRRDGRLIGHSTDGEGFVRSLREETGLVLAGKNVCLLGTGGAALALAFRLSREGVAGLLVVTRRRAEQGLGWPAGATLMPTRLQTYEELATDPEPLAGYDLLINATPAGMHPHEEAMPPIPAPTLRPGMIVYDLIYRPERTRLLRAAEAAGAVAVGGLGMLVHQGAVSFELWTGMCAPTQVMRDAAAKALCQQ